MSHCTDQPVAWRHDGGPFAGIAITRSENVAKGWISRGWKVTPLYQQDCVTALQAEIERQKAIAAEYQQLISHMNAGGDFFAFQRSISHG